MSTQKSNAGKKVVTKKETTKKGKIDGFDFDNLDLLNLDSKLKEVNASVKGENFIYKFERLTLTKKQKQSFRTKLRNNRDKILVNLLIAYKKSNVSEMKIHTNNFDLFYKKEYCLHNYTIESLCSSNTKDKSLLELFINCAKQFKLNESTEVKKVVKKRLPKEKKVIESKVIESIKE